jgi:hypothetical protein
MDLFLNSNLTFEKLAASTALSEDPNQWPQEAIQELFKQVPYISDFTPHVTMQKVDGERGYGLGFVTVSNQSEMQPGASPADEAAAGIRQVRIPIIIRDGKLLSFDLLITDQAKILPLTESRLRASMFRPQAFDVTSKTPGDQSMIGQLYPPYRQNYGMAGVIMPGGDMAKASSALEGYLEKDAIKEPKLTHDAMSRVEHQIAKDWVKKDPKNIKAKSRLRHYVEEYKPTTKTGSVLQSILPTINASDLDAFRETITDTDVRLAYEKNAAATVGAVSTLLKHEPVKLASPLELVKPTVIQIVRSDDGYVLKTASHKAWAPRIENLDRGQALQKLGHKIVLAADESGALTMAEGADAGEPAQQPAAETAAPVSEPGIYKVQKDDGEEIVGVVLPSLVDIDGSEVPIALFSNGSQAAVQTDVLGTPVTGGDVDLPEGGAPQGYGVFFNNEGGALKATIPLNILASKSGPDMNEPAVFMAETYDGNPVEVSVQPNIQAVTGSPEGRMLIPESWRWSSLDNAAEVSLASAEPEVNKQASAMREFASVEIRSGGSTFSISGPAVEKLASAEKSFLGINDAMFVLAALGVEQEYGIKKLAESMTCSAPVRVRIGRYIKLASEQEDGALKIAQARLARLPSLRRQLFKEAAVIGDPDAVDTVLSLGFINPENIVEFINYIPQLDESQGKMCELLMASRLGLSDVPEGALEKAVRATEEVIEGLKTIAFQNPAEYN